MAADPPHNRMSHCAIATAALILVVAGGCQSYRPQPLELSAHRQAFLARAAEAPEVAEFARSLAERDGGAERVFEPADGITLWEAEAIALVFNTDLRLARLRAGVTAAGAAEAGHWEDPTIGVDLTRIIQSTAHPWKLASAFGLTIPISGRLEIEKAKASAEHATELARVAEEEWHVRMDLRRAWTHWSALSAELATTRDFLTRADQILRIVELMERAGEVARTEARLFRIERARAALELIVLEANEAQQTLEIRRLLGLAPQSPIILVAEGVGVGPDATVLEVGVESREAPYLETSPMLLVASTEYQVAERALELEVRRQYPDLQIGPGYGFDEGQDELLLGLSLPLPIFNGNRRAIAEAAAARDLARAAAEVALEQLIASLAAADVQLRAATSRRQALESEVVPMVDAQYADARELARLGEVNTLVLLESLNRQQEAKLGLIAALRDEALATVRITELLGPPRSSAAALPDQADPTEAEGANP